jgi:hypothetical protein
MNSVSWRDLEIVIVKMLHINVNYCENVTHKCEMLWCEIATHTP